MSKGIWILLPPSLLFLLSQFYRATSSVIASELMHDFSLTTENLGLLSSVFFYAFALIQIPMGVAIDIFRPRRVIVILSSVGVIGSTIFALADTFSVAFIGRALMGIGMASALMGTYRLISIWFPVNAFATLSCLVLSVGTMGNIAATGPLAFAVDWMGWRKAFLLIVVVHLFITFWVYMAVKDYREKPAIGIMNKSTLHKTRCLKGSRAWVLSVFQLPSFWFIAIAAFIRYGTYVSIAGLWAGPYLEHVYQMPLINRGRMLMIIPIGYFIGGPIFGFLSDRTFRNRKFIALLGMSLYTISILPLIGVLPTFSHFQLAVVFFLFGFFPSCGPVTTANLKELLPSSISGTAMSALNFFTVTGAGFFQYILGIIIGKFSLYEGQIPCEAFSWAFSFCFFAAALGTIGYLFVDEVHL